ncbi:MAG: hypothetical protein HY606_13920 [Planctomycetes bacterium]|nr:hypothetical protein [Planctomycetota bacterium]
MGRHPATNWFKQKSQEYANIFAKEINILNGSAQNVVYEYMNKFMRESGFSQKNIDGDLYRLISKILTDSIRADTLNGSNWSLERLANDLVKVKDKSESDKSVVRAHT